VVGASDTEAAGWRYSAKRSMEVFKIFEQEFGGSDRLVKIMSSQPEWRLIMETMLEAYQNPVINTDSITINAMAISPYFASLVGDQIGDDGLIASITIDEIIDSAARAMNSEVPGWMATNKELADSYGVKLIAYEGGQLLGTTNYRNNSTLIDKLADANRYTRMEGLYQDFFDTWYQNGGGLFASYDLCFRYDEYHTSGLLEYLNQPQTSSPKWMAHANYVFTDTNTSNTTPVAVIVGDTSIRLGDTYYLDGSTSADADTDPLSYSWKIISGTGAAIADATDSKTLATFANGDTFTFRLTVADATSIDTEEITIWVTAAPIAVTGSDTEVPDTASILLNGSNSYDSDAGTVLQYLWIADNDSISIANTTDSVTTATFTGAGNYTLTLNVHDGVDTGLADTFLANVYSTSLMGDFTADNSSGGKVDAADLVVLSNEAAQYWESAPADVRTDLDNDGKLEFDDVSIFGTQYGTTE